MSRAASVSVVGAGVFGSAAAVELSRRGHRVTLIDPGPIPHPAASSTDTSKAIRPDYGRDEFYVDLAVECVERWRDWNREWDEPVFHEVGILMLTAGPMPVDGFEADSFEVLRARGMPLERLSRSALAARFPAWRDAPYEDAYFNLHAGWAASGRVVAKLAELARDAGAVIREGARAKGLLERGGRVGGVVLEGGETLHSDFVIVAAGAWTPMLLPWVAELTWPVGQPVVYFRPPDPAPFEGPRFPVWCADISNTGWYGFPVTRDGLLKVANHGPGRRIRAGQPLELEADELQRFPEFLTRTFARIAGSPIVSTRLCLYCDSFDGDFLIDHDPDRPGLVVACGGSGHGFKFAPALGPLIADVLEGKANARAGRFGWRKPGRRRVEQARFAR